MKRDLNCWCGNTKLTPFSPEYLRCPVCETLIAHQMPGPEISQVLDDEKGFYGREYWFSHQEKDLGFSNIVVRSQTDLPERCLHWLRAVLKYKLPPAQVLELGCAHGGFVALLRWAGYDATGLELSPWVANFARKTFDVPILVGPVETQQIKPRSLDIIVLMDVLEHLRDPAATIQHCLGLVKSNGLLIVQTPRYPEGKDHAQMLAGGDRFLEILQKDEHLYLFSQRSIREFFRRLGVKHLLFEPAIFEHYDMFFVASRVPLSVNSPRKISKVLTSTAKTRIVPTLLDLDKQFRDLKTSYNVADADRAARLKAVEQLSSQLKESEADRAARLKIINQLNSRMEAVEVDRATQLKASEQLSFQLKESEADRIAQQKIIEQLNFRLDGAERDRITQGETIKHLSEVLVAGEAERAARLKAVEQLSFQLKESEADRAARLEIINQLNSRMEAVEADRATRLKAVEQLSFQLKQAEADRAARLKAVEQLSSQLKESEADRIAQQKIIEQLNFRLDGAERDRITQGETIKHLSEVLVAGEAERAARLKAVEQLSLRLDGLEKDRITQGETVKRLSGDLAASEAARQHEIELFEKQLSQAQAEGEARLEVIADHARRLKELEAERDRVKAEKDHLRVALERIHLALQALCNGRIYRLMRRLGRWGWLEQELLSASFAGADKQSSKSEEQKKSGVSPRLGSKLNRVAVDVTPLLPGGENGGAKLLATSLIQHMSQIAPECEFILLTSRRSHSELAGLDAPNVRRLCVVGQADDTKRWTQLKNRLRTAIADGLPPSVGARLKSVSLAVTPRQGTPLREIGADLLFCPFTAPFFFDPAVPTVSIIYDLQFLSYPQFFNVEERRDREKHFRDACRRSVRLTCISNFVRNTVIDEGGLNPDQVIAVPIRLFDHLQKISSERVTSILQRLEIGEKRFLLYPANFWPHKNHVLLFTALGMYQAQNPNSDLQLICTGSPDARLPFLQTAVERMGLKQRVVFPGYLSDEEFTALLQSCWALIFPSLYEGFGMPVLEAMAFGKPVLCSNLTSLPEIAGDAAIFFDPRKPSEIVSAIEQLEEDPSIIAHLTERGFQRVAALGNAAGMARDYLQVFREAASAARYHTDALHGVYADGWTTERLAVTYGPDLTPRDLEISLTAPPWFPFERALAKVVLNGQEHLETLAMERGQVVTLRRSLPPDEGFIELLVSPTFQPKARGMNEDSRVLGCLCQKCQIISADKTIDLLADNG